jgi:hypothetical protein
MRYPEVKNELHQKEVLEQVLIRYLSELPKTELLNGSQLSNGDDLELGFDDGGIEIGDTNLEICPPPNNISQSEQAQLVVTEKFTACANQIESNTNRNKDKLLKLINSKKKTSCYFCLSDKPEYLISVCSGWSRKSSDESNETTPMCTPYTELFKAKEDLMLANMELVEKNRNQLIHNNILEQTIMKYEKSEMELKSTIANLENEAISIKKGYEQMIHTENKRRELDVESIIQQHNTHLSELKRLHKVSVAKLSQKYEHRINELTVQLQRQQDILDYLVEEDEVQRDSQDVKAASKQVVNIKANNIEEMSVSDLKFEGWHSNNTTIVHKDCEIISVDKETPQNIANYTVCNNNQLGSNFNDVNIKDSVDAVAHTNRHLDDLLIHDNDADDFDRYVYEKLFSY